MVQVVMDEPNVETILPVILGFGADEMLASRDDSEHPCHAL